MVRFTYIYDTYCGWCYGASKVIEALLNSGADIELLHRHLFNGANAPRMADGFGQMALRYDRKIAELTGAEFSQRYIDQVLLNADEVLESSLTAWAAALVHGQGPATEIALCKVLQQARFVDGMSAENTGFVRSVLLKFDVHEPLEQGHEQAQAISLKAAKMQTQMGLSGVPILLRHSRETTQRIDIADFYETPTNITALLDPSFA